MPLAVSLAQQRRSLLCRVARHGRESAFCLTVLLLSAGAVEGADDLQSLRIEPDRIVLAGPGESQRLLVTAVGADGWAHDVTEQVRISTSQPDVISVDASGTRVEARRPGRATIRAGLGSLAAETVVHVRSQPGELAVSFAPDIVSILTLKGCNGSACHGSPAGQNGFKLSLFGYDLAADHQMIVHGDEGRRVDLAQPERSLFLAKPTFQQAHGGGRLMEVGSEEYESILGWLRQGAPLDTLGVQLERLELYPSDRVLVGLGVQQPLVAIGRLSDGSTRDMSRQVRYFSADEGVVTVAADGLLSTTGIGLTTVMARAMGKVATAQAGVISERGESGSSLPETNNLIDQAVFSKLRKMNVRPAPVSTDREFVRRVYLDTVGLLPTQSQLQAFLEDSRNGKRELLVDHLLGRPAHASHWTVKFEDWFRNSQIHSQGRSMGVFKDWVRDWLEADRPYDEFVHRLITSTGDTMLNPAANFWHPATDFMLKEFSVAKATPTVSRLFLGVRMECAECHNHPLENFTQDDFYGLAAFFARLRVKHGYGEYRRTWYLADSGEVEHPVTGKPVAPKLLGGAEPRIPEGADRRTVLAEWIVSPDNPYFARATVNRVWHQYFGTGIVEPYDDFRSTNRPSNPDLLDRLARYFADNGFRLRPLHRLILTSRTYQLSSRSGSPGPLDDVLFARYMPRKLEAEVLLDALGQVTGLPHEFEGYPKGTLAKDIYVPDGPDDFLVTFGLPRRDILRDRVTSPTLGQALHLMNGRAVREKVEAEHNILGRLLAQGLTDEQIASHLFERAYARLPTPPDLERVEGFLESERMAGRDRRRAFENVLWAVVNSKEFQLNH